MASFKNILHTKTTIMERIITGLLYSSSLFFSSKIVAQNHHQIKSFLSLLLLVLISQTVTSQTGPGGVDNTTNNNLWLKSNKGAENVGGIDAWNGESTNTRKDQSGISNDLSQRTDTTRPTFSDNGINRNPMRSSNQPRSAKPLNIDINHLQTEIFILQITYNNQSIYPHKILKIQ